MVQIKRSEDVWKPIRLNVIIDAPASLSSFTKQHLAVLEGICILQPQNTHFHGFFRRQHFCVNPQTARISVNKIHSTITILKYTAPDNSNIGRKLMW
jgi:hypothetical protein